MPIRLLASSRISRGRAAEQDHFQAAVLVEMDVGRGHDPVEVVVLQVGQPPRDPRGVVVVDQGDDAHRLALVLGDHLFDQGRAHQAAHGLAPVRIAMHLAILVELLEQLAADRDAESDQRGLSRVRFSSGHAVTRRRFARQPFLSSADLGDFDPFAVLLRAGDGGLDEGHAGDAVGDAGVLEGLGDLLAAFGADRPFQGPVQVGERLVEPLGVSGGESEVRLDETRGYSRTRPPAGRASAAGRRHSA